MKILFVVACALIDADRRADLNATLNRIVAEIDPDATAAISEGPLSDPRYETPLSGLYWQVKDLDTGDVIRSRSLWDIELPTTVPPDGRADLRQVAVDDRPLLVALTRAITMERSGGEERHAECSAKCMRSSNTIGMYSSRASPRFIGGCERPGLATLPRSSPCSMSSSE